MMKMKTEMSINVVFGCRFFLNALAPCLAFSAYQSNVDHHNQPHHSHTLSQESDAL